MHKISQRMRDDIRGRDSAGKARREIAAECNVPMTVVRAVLERRGAKRPRLSADERARRIKVGLQLTRVQERKGMT